jgi:hypothetical protein
LTCTLNNTQETIDDDSMKEFNDINKARKEAGMMEIDLK